MRSINLLIFLAWIGVLHAAYSTYEHLSRLKSLGQPEGDLPFNIVVEVLLSLVLGIVGANFGEDSELKDISWRTEMRKRPIEQMINPFLTFPEFKKGAK
ncbi:hypothetical protein BJ322DRAFT_814666 [Thelephora terrestris]|uniref:Membrane magnesium transporter n=1 Tax=Thelephora terrestris TaxID=56493 RepID=A0A9P6HE65_9AGAM|nr:hypothetical protein BJ322DRAFT_814666 [Thelephora terrestris]